MSFVHLATQRPSGFAQHIGHTVLSTLLLWCAMTLLAAGCRNGACTQIGCADEGVAIHLPAMTPDLAAAEISVTSCVAERCAETAMSGSDLAAGVTVLTPVLEEPDISWRRAEVSVTVTEQEGSKIIYENRGRARAATSQPNGADCPSTCLSAEDVHFDE